MIQWAPPAKGDWRGLHDHFPRALTPEYQRLLAHGMETGEAMYFADYGLPARTLQPAFVHGRVFVSAAPLVGPASNRLPPMPVLWLAVRLVPAFRRRGAAARRALAERRWLAEAEHWYGVERDEWIDRNQTLEAVDPVALDDDALADHLVAVRANVAAGYTTHFRLHGADLLPTAFFLARAGDWGIAPTDAAALLAGSSPASRSGALPSPWCLVTGYDLDERCAAELPDRPLGPERPPPSDDSAASPLRDRVPVADRPEWDERLADARATYGVRDDNGLITGAWTVGLLRRAMLVAGDRLVAAGVLAERGHAVELLVDEVLAALRGSPTVTAAAAAARLVERRRLSAEPVPASLGPTLDLPLAALPPAMRFVIRGLLTVRDVGVTPPGDRPPLEGIGIGGAPVTGRACVARDPASAFARFEPGDIIVTTGTCPAWNALLALAGGVVTEEGGPLSHAAVIAREMGLPALIGTAEAVARIDDGSQITLDPVAGTVRPAVVRAGPGPETTGRPRAQQ